MIDGLLAQISNGKDRQVQFLQLARFLHTCCILGRRLDLLRGSTFNTLQQQNSRTFEK